MAEDLNLIQRFVGALIRRERRLIAGTAAVRLFALLALLVLTSVIAARAHWDRSSVLMALVGISALGLWVAVWVPLLTRWRPAGDPMRQARQVEALAPELRGRLLTAVEHVDGARASESEALLGLVARRAAKAVGGIATSRVHPAAHLFRIAAIAIVFWMVALPSTLFAPGGPGGLLRFWGSGLDARAAVAALSVDIEEDTARVGDLEITYVYPDYTGLDPRTVSNTTGDTHGPPGTVVGVTARSADPVEAAGLLAYDQAFDANVSDDGRELQGDFRIGLEAGTWRMVLYRDGTPERSRAFAIEPEPDLPPEVLLEAEAVVLEVAVDEPLALQWRARDDYGVRRAVLMGTKIEQSVLYEMRERKAESWGDLMLRPSELGLGPGDETDLFVRAWDNDTVSGSKYGDSQPIHLVVLGAMGHNERRGERHEELEALMVPVLARFLTEAWPPGADGKDVVRWGEKVARRYEPLQVVVEKQWRGLNDDALDRNYVTKVISTGRDLVRYTQVAFQPDGTSRPSGADLLQAQEMRDAAVVALERALLAFLKEAQLKALKDAYAKAEELETSAELLREALSKENPDTMELLARLDQLERLFAQLSEMTAKMQTGGLKSFMNQRESELQGMMEEIRQAIAEGRLDDAQRLMERLAKQLEEMAGGIQSDLEQRQANMQSAQDQAGDLRKELVDLEQEQTDLQTEARAMREEEDGSAAEQAAKLWQKVDDLVDEALKLGTGYRAALGDAERPFYERERASAAVESVEVLRSAVRARDIRGSRNTVAEAVHQWIVAQRTALNLFERASSLAGPRPEVAGRIERKLEEVSRLLDQLDQTSSSLDSEAVKKAEEMRDRQKDLQNRLDQAREQVTEVMRNMPVEPEGMPEALDEASERMGQAGEDLDDGKLMAAEGSQGVASERIRKARMALEQAMRASSRMQQAGQQGGEGQDGQQGQEGEEGEEGENGRDSQSYKDVYIPGREAYESPEAYRRALLEGMQGDVPEAYRAWKKRYYEELVHQ